MAWSGKSLWTETSMPTSAWAPTRRPSPMPAFPPTDASVPSADDRSTSNPDVRTDHAERLDEDVVADLHVASDHGERRDDRARRDHAGRHERRLTTLRADESQNAGNRGARIGGLDHDAIAVE